MDETKIPTVHDYKGPEDSSDEGVSEVAQIYVDPEKEKAALKKFDKIFLPQAFIFLVLNYLDRSNVSKILADS